MFSGTGLSFLTRGMSNYNSPYTVPENGLTSKGNSHQPIIAQASEDHGLMVTNRSGVQGGCSAQWQNPVATAQPVQSAQHNAQRNQSEASTHPVRTASSNQSQTVPVRIDPNLDHLRYCICASGSLFICPFVSFLQL